MMSMKQKMVTCQHVVKLQTSYLERRSDQHTLKSNEIQINAGLYKHFLRRSLLTRPI